MHVSIEYKLFSFDNEHLTSTSTVADEQERQFVFLLSSKAGGCGINLIGGNRLILFDPDW